MKIKLHEQFDNVNLPAIMQSAEDAIAQLTGPDYQENEIRVKDLFEKITDWNNANPSSKITFVTTQNNQQVDLTTNLPYFRVLFFKKETLGIVFTKLWNKQLSSTFRPEIPDKFSKFVRKYIVKEQTSQNLSIYAGVYQNQENSDLYNIVVDANKIYFRETLGRVPLTQDGSNFKSANGKYDLTFNVQDGKVTGGTFRIVKDYVQYEYDVVKISGPGGQSSQLQDPDIKDDVWKCINIFLKDNGFVLLSYKLDKPQTWVAVKGNVKGEKVEYAFDEDGTAYLRTRDTETVIKKGTWECTADGISFLIEWEDGTTYDPMETVSLDDENDQDEESNSSQTDTEQSSPPKPRVVPCQSFSSEPSVQKVISGEKVIKKCMSGPIIESIQKMPVFQSYYFDVLRTNGQKEIVDDKFGPYMEKAVKIYQSTNGIYTLNVAGSGIIDKKTYELLVKQNENRPGAGPESPKPTPTPSPVPPKPKFADEKTKF